MFRIPTLATISDAATASRPLLKAVKRQLGSAPNIFGLISDSPAALEGYMALSGALNKHWPLGRRPDDHRGWSDLGL